MPVRFLFVLFIFYSGACLTAQTVSGKITTAAGKPVPFASVLCLQDSAFVATAIAAEDGRFVLSGAFRPATAYRLRLSATGYQTLERSFVFPDTLLFQRLVLAPDAQTLAEVTVSSRQPLITRQADRYIVTVENSFLANGHTSLEVLQKAPGVWVDSKGGIHLRGNQPVQVMINNVLQQLSGDELSDYLRSLRSEDISRIEVIPTPPAEFEAGGAGGIIHILLKKPRKDGWNGTASGQYRQQGPQPYGTAGLTAGYGRNRLVLSGSYVVTDDHRPITERADITRSNGSYYHNSTDRREAITRNQYRLGAVYDLSPTQSLSLQTALLRNRFAMQFASNEAYSTAGGDAKGLAHSVKHRLFTLGSATLNYNWKIDTAGSTLRVIADYTNNEKEERNFFDNTANDPALNGHSRNEAPMNTEIGSLQADYTKPLRGKNLLRSGIKASTISRDNRLLTEAEQSGSWVTDPGLTNRFVYTEGALMGYVSIEAARGANSLKAGLRGEQTFAKGVVSDPALSFHRSYSGLFPSLFWLHTVSATKGQSWSVGYSRRLTRPALSDLNPARLVFSQYTVLRGNPDLQPQYTHNLSVGYSFSKAVSAEVYAERTLNYIALSAQPGSGNTIEYLSSNVGNTFNWSVYLSASKAIVPGWSVTNNASFNQVSYRYNGRFYQQGSFAAKSVHTVALGKGWDLDAVADYRSPYVYTNIYTRGVFSIDAGLAKKLWKEKVRLRLSVADLLNTVQEKELTKEGDTRIYFYRKRATRTAGLSLTYNFVRGKKFTARKIEAGSAEERGRIGS